MPEKNQPTKWCAIYTRKSTDENLDSGFTSLDAQKEYCEAFIKSREGQDWRAFPVYYDDGGYTGGNMDRPALKRLVADAKAGKFQVVVCYKYDRLSRNTRDFLYLMDLFDKHGGVAFCSVTQPIDTTNSTGRLMRSILMDFAQFERELISERTRDKRAAMARKGKWPGGYPVLGYDIEPETKALLVNAEETKLVRAMFEAYLKTKSLSAAAKFLNAKGYRLKEWLTKDGSRKGGRKFNKTNLSYMLNNPIYIGKIRHNEELFDGEHKPILDENVFNRAQKLLKQNGKKNKSENQDKHNFLLRGLVRCSCCNYQMTPNFAYSKGKKYFYYKCVSVNNMDKEACKVGSVAARELEKIVIDRLGFLGRNKMVVDQIVERAQKNSVDQLAPKKREKTLAAAELGKTQTEAQNLVAILAQKGPAAEKLGFIVEKIEELQKKSGELKQKIERIEQEILSLEERQINADVIRHNLFAFSKVFNRLSPEKQKELVALLVKEVVYAPEESKIKLVLRPLPDLGWQVNQNEVSFDERTNLLRIFGAHLTRLDQIKRDFEAKNELNGVSRLRDVSDFDLVNGRYGRRQVLFPQEAVVIKNRQRRYREPRPLRIQVLLKQAYELRERLDKTPGLKKDILARELGISPTRVAMILNLLNLAPAIQRHILALPPAVRMGPLTERSLRPLARSRDKGFQLKEFNRILSPNRKTEPAVSA